MKQGLVDLGIGCDIRDGRWWITKVPGGWIYTTTRAYLDATGNYAELDHHVYVPEPTPRARTLKEYYEE